MPLAQQEPDPPAATSQETPAVELLGISKSFPGVRANDDISLALRRGEVHCLLGENGAGKSTLMGILAGMVQPDEGRIRIDGRDVRITSPRTALELGIGTVYQHSTLIGALTVLENLVLGDGRGLRLNIAGARRRIEEFSAMLGVAMDPEVRARERLAEHQPHDLRLELRRRAPAHLLAVDRAGQPALAQHGDAVAECDGLVQLVGDEDDGEAVLAQPAEHGLQLAHGLRREHRGRLVEDQHPGSAP